MKVILAVSAFLMLQHAQACIGEAQFIAKVEGLQKLGKTCFVVINPASVKYYAENITCPLYLDEVVQSGVAIGMKDEETCNYNVGAEISGVIVKSQDGTLSLE
jgi:hypothetical protein